VHANALPVPDPPRRVLHAHDHETDLGEFVRLGALTVPPILLASTLALWLALRFV